MGEKEKRERERSPTKPVVQWYTHMTHINSIDIDRIGVMNEKDMGSRTKMSVIYVATVVKIFCFLFSKFAAAISLHITEMYFLTQTKKEQCPYSLFDQQIRSTFTTTHNMEDHLWLYYHLASPCIFHDCWLINTTGPVRAHLVGFFYLINNDWYCRHGNCCNHAGVRLNTLYPCCIC